MNTIIKTTGSQKKLVKTSNGTTLDLNVSSEDEIKSVVKDFQDALGATKSQQIAKAKELSTKVRDALYDDLGAAAHVAEMLTADEKTAELLALCETHSVPQVINRSTRNIYVAVARLLWGYWTKGTAEKPSVYVYTRQAESYGKVLRGAVLRKISPSKLAETLKAEKGFKQFHKADDEQYLKTDEDVKKADQDFQLVVDDKPIASVPLDARFEFTNEDRNRGVRVLLLGKVNRRGDGVDVLHRIPASDATIDNYVRKLATEVFTAKARERKATARAEAAEAKLAEMNQSAHAA